MFSFIQELDEMAKEARNFIAQGELKKAERLAKKLDRSPYSEGWVHASKLLARICLLQGKREQAKALAQKSLINSWGDPELLAICRSTNPPVTASSRSYTVCIRAGGPFGNPLSMFDERYIVTAVVVADDASQALEYIKGDLNLGSDFTPDVAAVESSDQLPPAADTCGIYWNSAFSRA